ncbi:MAG: sigma-70 family RNA polymerase sigma factor [Lachnospiraceae bacterium]|nr:sigma-70 family RNA polymerase sigma factor [Lachnospiraceae bacterium]
MTFEEVYNEYFSYIYNIIYARTLNRAETEDLVSDVFFRAMENYGRFNPEKASIKTWICTIARNRLIDYYRSGARTRNVLMANEDMKDFPVEDEYNVEKDDINREAHRILALLSNEERELISMRFFMEMKNTEIAEKLGISSKAVCERYRRLLKKCETLTDKNTLRELLS